MATIEDQITKAEERLAALQAKAKEREQQTEQAIAKGPSARTINQLARDVRTCGRAIEVCVRCFEYDARSVHVAEGMKALQDILLKRWRAGYDVKIDYADKTGDSGELDKLQNVEAMLGEFATGAGASDPG